MRSDISGVGSLVRAAGLLVAALMTFGCGDGDDPPRRATKSPNGDTSSDSLYSIKFFVTDQQGKTTQYKAGPHLALAKKGPGGESIGSQHQKLAGQPKETGEESDRLGSSQQALRLCKPGTGGTSSQSCEDVPETETTSSADILLQYAYESCRPERIVDAGQSAYKLLPDYGTPWLEDNWYFFKDKVWTSVLPLTWRSCDEVLVAEEALLCVADRLGEVADAVDTTVWYNVDYAGNDFQQPVTVRIPPQAMKDRFIARDLALNVLGHLARLDGVTPTMDPTNLAGNYVDVDSSLERMGGCNAGYGAIIKGEITDLGLKMSVLDFEVPVYRENTDLGNYLQDTLDGGDTTLTDAERALNRLSYKTQILRASARLTRDIVDKSLSADLAGAEWQRAHAADPMLGLRSMWGQDPTNPDAYNSLEHALKMLFGRLETERSTNDYYQSLVDPACGGHDSWDLLDALGPGFSSRWQDQAPATAGQSLALSTVAKSGVVVPSAQLVTANATNLRKGVKARLMWQAALAQDADKTLTSTEETAFENTTAGQAVAAVLDAKSISDDELLFGLNQALNTYRLLTDSPADITTITAAAGLRLATSGADATITMLGGAVVEGGLPRSDLASDITGLVGRAASASQCELSSASLWSQGNDTDTLFQSPFLLANALGQRLDDMGKLLAPLGLDGAADAATAASLAAGEVRAWAGDAVVMHGWGDYAAESAAGICPPPDVSGAPGFCSKECPCEEGEGACVSDDQCGSGMVCYRWGNGTWWGMTHDSGVCVSKTSCADWLDASSSHNPSDPSFCSKCKCAAGKGDCGGDNTACKPGLSCVANAGAKFGLGSGDVCLPAGFPVASCPPRSTTYSEDYCSESCPCVAGQGDADQNSDCYGSTRLQANVGNLYNISNNAYDMCVPSYQSNVQTFVLSGLQPKDFGVSTGNQLVNKISIVFGQPWMAECVASRRKSCPDDLSSTSTVPGFYRVDLSSSNTTTVATGYQGRPGPSLIGKFALDPTSVAGENNSWYVIAHGDAASGRNEGRILATLAQGRMGTSTMEVVSAYRDQRANEIFGLSASPQSTQTCTDVGSTSLPGNYCIEGMQRNMFVPLANELTNQGGPQEDSWRHYLALAEQAATEADELGRQMIEAGKERDRKKLDDQIFDYNREVTLQQRREAAQEKLAEICGAFVTQDDVELDREPGAGFTVKASRSPEVAACIAADKVDVVYLGADPFAGSSADLTFCDLRGCKDNLADGVEYGMDSYDPTYDPSTNDGKQNFLRSLYCNGKEADELSEQEQQTLPAFCMNVTDIQTAGLNIAEVPPAFSLDNCEAISDVNESANSTNARYNKLPGSTIGKLTSEPWASPGGMGAALARLKYGHSEDGGWGVTAYGTPILGNALWLNRWFPGLSHQSVFPACEDAAGGCKCGGAPVRSCTVRALRAMFGGPFDSTDEVDQEQVRLNVERALWHMGALSGQIPAGTFYVTLPVANLRNATEASLPPAIYGNGGFVEDSLTAGKYILEEVIPESPLSLRGWLGQGTPMTRGFAQRLEGSARKPWVSRLYLDAYNKLADDTGGPAYLTVGAANSYISFNERFWTFKEMKGGGISYDATGLTRANLAEWLKEFARNVDGQKCSDVGSVRLPVAALSAYSPSMPNRFHTYWSRPYPYRFVPNADGICYGPNCVPTEDQLPEYSRETCGGTNVRQGEAARILIESGSNAQTIWFRGGGHTSANVGRDEMLTFTGGDEDLTSMPTVCPREAPDEDVDCHGCTAENTCDCTVDFTDDEKRDTCLAFGPRIYSKAWTSLAGCGDYWINQSCLDTATQSNGDELEFDSHRFAARQLRPDVCRPEQRVELFVDRTVDTECGATLAMTQALGLSCLAAKAPGKGLIVPPAQVTNLGELQQLEAWLSQVREVMSRAAGAIYLLSLPKQSIQDFQNDTLSTSSIGKGNHGQLMLSLHASLLGMSNSWTNLNLALGQIQDSVALAKAKLEENRLMYEARLDQGDLQRLELNRQDAMRAVAGAGKTLNEVIGAVGGGATAVAGAYTGNPVAAIAGLQQMAASVSGLLGTGPEDEMAAAEVQYNGEIRSVLDRLSTNAADTKGVQDLISLLGLSKDTKAEFKNANDALYQLRLQSLTALGTLNLLKQNRDKAKWQLGIIAGANFVEFKGKVTSQEINHVLARQYDGQRIRYERALERAKRAAYLARLSIEQRLGVRFAGVNEPIGSLRQAPSVWIDDICTLQGIDYNALKTSFGEPLEDGSDAPSVVDDITIQYADSFIGDYVTQLKELVEFYNVERPFHESDDVAVLSLKDDLLNGDATCVEFSKNELLHSDALYRAGTTDGDLSSYGGWRINRCAGTSCLEVASGEALNAANRNLMTLTTETWAANDILPPGGMGGVSWLKPYTSALAPAPFADEVSPARTTYQSLDLAAGQGYLVTWWDMARAANGLAPSAMDVAQFSVNVYDSSWRLIGGDTITAAAPTVNGQAWSDRRQLTFFTTAEGTYHLAFQLLSTTASVAIANVQVEKAVTAGASASYYDSNDQRRLQHNAACDGSADLSRHFKYECEGSGASKSCFWALDKLIRLDTEALNEGVGPLVGKVGAGNYNHRVLSTAVNVVGSGVIDCAQDPRSSCYGSSYLEYDMDHSAFRIPIDDYSGAVRCFDFGNGTIRGAKALATERYITTPISGSDAQLIEQAAFTKQELAGRPLSGQYRFRIKDTSALQWANVEDIQLVVSYRYWARVGRN